MSTGFLWIITADISFWCCAYLETGPDVPQAPEVHQLEALIAMASGAGGPPVLQ